MVIMYNASNGFWVKAGDALLELRDLCGYYMCGMVEIVYKFRLLVITDVALAQLDRAFAS